MSIQKLHGSEGWSCNPPSRKKKLPFVTQYHPSAPDLKNISTDKWYSIERQPLFRETHKDLPSSHIGKESQKNYILVGAKP